MNDVKLFTYTGFYAGRKYLLVELSYSSYVYLLPKRKLRTKE